MTKHQGRASALRCSGLGEFLVRTAWTCCVSYRIVAEIKGLLHTTIYFEVEGAEEDVQKYVRRIRRMFEFYNREV